MGFRLANVAGRAALVEGEHYFDLERVSPLGSGPMQALAALDLLREAAANLRGKSPDGLVADAALEAPVPEPRNCFAVGLNYRLHARETNMDEPELPMFFAKHSNCIAGPQADIELRSDFVDYEAELVVAIGRPGRDIAAGDAWGHVAGLCAGQDVSDRPVQVSSRPAQYNLGKSFDTFGPIGPMLVSPDALADPAALEVRCEVNGELRQRDNTRNLIFDIPTLIAYLSGIVTLRPGDLIFTGTPSGVGVAQGKFLRDGDVVVTTVEGVGEMRNRCVRKADHPRAQILPEAFVKRWGRVR